MIMRDYPVPNTLRDLADLSRLRPLMATALEADRYQLDESRTIALDLATVVAAKVNRYLAVAALLTLGQDKEIADAVRATPKVTGLIEALGDRSGKFERLSNELQTGLGEFRTFADTRLGNVDDATARQEAVSPKLLSEKTCRSQALPRVLCVRARLAVTERVVRLIGGDAGFAAPVAFSGEQVPGALGLGQLAAAAELPEVQVRFCCPAPSSGAPVTQHRRGVQVGHAAGAGQLIYIGSNPVQDRRHPGQVGHHVRPLGAVALWAQVDRRREPLGVQVGQPPGALAQPADLIEQAVADQVAAVQLGVVIPVGVFRGRRARRPQSSQGGIQLVHVRRGSDLVYPRW